MGGGFYFFIIKNPKLIYLLFCRALVVIAVLWISWEGLGAAAAYGQVEHYFFFNYMWIIGQCFDRRHLSIKVSQSLSGYCGRPASLEQGVFHVLEAFPWLCTLQVAESCSKL